MTTKKKIEELEARIAVLEANQFNYLPYPNHLTYPDGMVINDLILN